MEARCVFAATRTLTSQQLNFFPFPERGLSEQASFAFVGFATKGCGQESFLIEEADLWVVDGVGKARGKLLECWKAETRRPKLTRAGILGALSSDRIPYFFSLSLEKEI